MTELDLYKIFKDFLHRHYKRSEFHSVRIESWRQVGLPDWNFCINGADVWCELKVGANKIKFQDAQLSWLYQRARAKGLSYIVIADETQDVIRTFSGAQAREIMENGPREIECPLIIPLKPDDIKLQFWLDIVTDGATL